MSLAYSYEKLGNAMEILARSEDSLRVPLENAWLAFHPIVPARHLPEKLQARYTRLYRRMTRREAMDDEGTLVATLVAATPEELAWFACEIVALFEAIAVAYRCQQRAGDPHGWLAFAEHLTERRN